mgnify:CR=1 FL=1
MVSPVPIIILVIMMKRRRGGEKLIDVFVCPGCQESFATRKNLLIHYNRWCADREVAAENVEVAVEDDAEDKSQAQV